MIIYDSEGQVAQCVLSEEDAYYIAGQGTKGLALISVLTPLGCMSVIPGVKNIFSCEEEMQRFHQQMVRWFCSEQN